MSCGGQTLSPAFNIAKRESCPSVSRKIQKFSIVTRDMKWTKKVMCAKIISV
jgi:hypothetical protein